MKEKLFKQLNGFLKTPPLWMGEDFMELKQFKIPDIKLISDLDIATEIPSITTNFVLGKRMESFFELAIKLSNEHRFIAGNLQIRKEKVTSGELDFLVEDLRLQKVLHIEMVYKFYIYDPTMPNEIQRWIGPNRKDSLLRKINKLKKKQLPLLFKPETENTLSALNLSAKNLEQEVCFKANLFIPRGYKAEKIGLINTDCIAGVYLHRTEFSAEEFSGYQYLSPKKQDWPIEPGHNTTWFSYSEILPEINVLLDENRSPLLWVRKDEQTFERFFVVWW